MRNRVSLVLEVVVGERASRTPHFSAARSAEAREPRAREARRLSNAEDLLVLPDVRAEAAGYTTEHEESYASTTVRNITRRALWECFLPMATQAVSSLPWHEHDPRLRHVRGQRARPGLDRQESPHVRRLRGVHRGQARHPEREVERVLGLAQPDDVVPHHRLALEVGGDELHPRSLHPLEEPGQAGRRRQLQPRKRLLQLVPRRGDGLHVGLVPDARDLARAGAVRARSTTAATSSC